MYKRYFDDYYDECMKCISKIFFRIDIYIITLIIEIFFVYIIKFIIENTYYEGESGLDISFAFLIFILYPLFIFLILKDIIYIRNFILKINLIYLLCFTIIFNIIVININVEEKFDVFIFFKNPLYVLIALPFILFIAQNVALLLLVRFYKEKDN